MNVYFYNAANNSLIGTAFSVSNNSNASIVWSNLSYNTLYKWYVIVNDSFLENISDIWSFTTTFRSSLGDTSNQYPVADANGPYYGFINEEIEFNASGSIDNDGLIINYTWYFGDGVKGFGIKTTHIYDQFGEYTITLTVMDNNGAINTDKTLAVIRHPNRPPTIPVINGTINGTKNTYYNYTARSTDLDDDAIQYIFDWGDGNKISSEFLANGTLTIQTHSWTIAGKYIITVIAYDNYTYSEIASFIVLIDAHIVGEIGYITDDDTDGTYDTFHTANLETPLEREEDNYLIDSDGDTKRDYVYNLETGLITYFDYVYKKCFNLYQTTSKTPGFEMISVLLMIILVFIILRRRKLYE
ncbi:hypothetical protein AYK25_06325 [Thermoplasmatales archaeon SM1-50]|nr:MAG: hypothetical protein AYK25_06325 [Thermoplasmatales archaeon SM1-50]